MANFLFDGNGRTLWHFDTCLFYSFHTVPLVVPQNKVQIAGFLLEVHLTLYSKFLLTGLHCTSVQLVQPLTGLCFSLPSHKNLNKPLLSLISIK